MVVKVNSQLPLMEKLPKVVMVKLMALLKLPQLMPPQLVMLQKLLRNLKLSENSQLLLIFLNS